MRNRNPVVWFMLFGVFTLWVWLSAATSVRCQGSQSVDKSELAQNLIVKVIGDNVSGSGIVFGQMGEMLFIATANHVVRRGTKEAQNLRVGFKFWFEEIEANLLGKFDRDLDLAVLLVDLKKSALDSEALSQYLPLTQIGYVSGVQDSSNLYPVGHPPGADWYIPKPLPQLHEVEGESIRFHFQCDQGYSGGGLFNEDWGLIGMIVRFNPPVCEAVSFERIQTALEKWRFMVSLKPQKSLASVAPPRPTATPTPHPTLPPRIQLRSEPLIVLSDGEARKIFRLDSNWRPLKYIENDFERQGDVVIDHATGLMWQKSGSDSPMYFNQAQKYIEELNEERFSGYNDWRLPTVDELLSLMERKPEANDLMYISPIFDAMRQRTCWSADKSTLEKEISWYVSFLYGNVDWTNSPFFVRAVRSFQ